MIVHIHGAEYLPFFDGLGPAGKKLVDSFLHRADLVLALSDSWRAELEARFPGAVCGTLYNGVELPPFSAGDPAARRRSFLMLGRLGERKGTYDLIEAMALAVRRDPALTLYLAGDGQVEQARALVARMGLEKNIDVPGWIGEEEKRRRLEQAAVVVLPSITRACPSPCWRGWPRGKPSSAPPRGRFRRLSPGKTVFWWRRGMSPAWRRGCSA